MEERYELMKERIAKIAKEQELPDNFRLFFTSVALFMADIFSYYERVLQGPLSREEGTLTLGKLYLYFLEDNYEESYSCPAYAKEQLGESGPFLSALLADLTAMIRWAAQKKTEYLVIFAELFVQIYGIYVTEAKEEKPDLATALTEAKDAYYWFFHDYTELFAKDAVRSQVVPEDNFYVDIIMNSDLSDLSYLYKYGAHIGEDEIVLANYILQMSEEEIQSMADTFTEGYRIGFEVTRKDITKKKSVSIHYPMGMERVVRASIENFRKMGLETTVMDDALFSATGRGKNGRQGAYTNTRNRQYEYDHKDDKALYYDKAYVERRLEALTAAFEENKEAALAYGGPAVVEVFGEKDFTPRNRPENLTLSEEQNHLNVYDQNRAATITNTYIPGEERSFTIISYPIPSIGENFRQVFQKTVEINTLDYMKYLEIQQHIVDALDKGYAVSVLGKDGNETDMTVMLHELKDPAKETNFENCVADVNIPVGEVFTSPVLEGTHGTLHVSRVHLEDYSFENLKLTFVDGKITEYTCTNFATEAENKKLIDDVILYHHKTLPIGEFAIGTNTTAYRVGRDYGIADKFTILIAEKTGPHFAVGDTCYDRAEDVAVFNPDGKEIIARDNSCSILRKTEPDKAYFNCHTDITIPFEELKEIAVLLKDGSRIPIISDGKFVLPGTEELNIPLEAEEF
ncbi:MAG: aminopeptidase [Lachnospiraceae bacterium]|nr:aminopeptidase [Lachnospiraceae bacterium]